VSTNSYWLALIVNIIHPLRYLHSLNGLSLPHDCAVDTSDNRRLINRIDWGSSIISVWLRIALGYILVLCMCMCVTTLVLLYEMNYHFGTYLRRRQKVVSSCGCCTRTLKLVKTLVLNPSCSASL